MGLNQDTHRDGALESDLRSEQVTKECENDNGLTRDGELKKEDDVGKSNDDDGGYFDCNICFVEAKDPVVTCCGHLFCWHCLYKWLHRRSGVNECPVCKGEVSYETVTPIYGRGVNNVQDPEADPNFKIPLRPHARRVENLRPNLHTSAFRNSMGDMFRRLTEEGFDLVDIVHGTHSFLNRFMTSSRAIRREQNHEATPYDSGYLDGDLEAEDESQRTHSDVATFPSFHFEVSGDSAVVTDFRTRNQEQVEQSVHVGDYTVYHSSTDDHTNWESQVDSNVEIDSMVSLSTSSPRRRNDSPTNSDVDNGDSLGP